MSSSDVNPEWNLIAIGRGSFATVSVLSGRPVAFKHVLSSLRTSELEAEFEALRSLYDSCESCDTNSFFSIPCPLAYYDPNFPTSFLSSESTPQRRSCTRARRPLVIEEDFKALRLDTAAYAMEQVLPLPLATARVIRSLFYPSVARDAPVPSLCRLYFGKVIDSGRPIRFFNSANFPLDVVRYGQVLAAMSNSDLPSMEEIAAGMGDMLGRIHWHARYDGRDVEFVLGGESFSGVEPYVVDFNQMRPWQRNKVDIQQLVESFFNNDPYFPRPRASDQLYKNFCAGYMAAHPKESKEATEVAEAFLFEIEAEQAKRDASKVTSQLSG